MNSSVSNVLNQFIYKHDYISFQQHTSKSIFAKFVSLLSDDFANSFIFSMTLSVAIATQY